MMVRWSLVLLVLLCLPALLALELGHGGVFDSPAAQQYWAR